MNLNEAKQAVVDYIWSYDAANPEVKKSYWHHFLQIMGKHKKKGVKKNKKEIIYRTKEQRQDEVREILKKLSETLGLDETDLRYSYEILRSFGNMSSATIMFLFAELLRKREKGNVFAAAFGPGLTMESGFLKAAAVSSL